MRLGSASIGWFHVAQKGRLGQGLGLMKVCRGWATARHQRRICGTTLTSERGGRSSWRRPGTATTTPIVGVTAVAPTPRPASLP
jgi:hypothetical protein